MQNIELFSFIVEQTELFICSLFASLLASISGGGGGFILLPALILFGLPFMEALGTHKTSMLFVGVGNLTHKHGLNGFSVQICLILFLIGVPGVILGTLAISLVPERAAKIALGILSITMSCYTLFSQRIVAEKSQILPSKTKMFTGIIFIFIIALLAGALSTGAGIFLTLILILFFNIDFKQAIRYSVLFASTVWNLVGAATVGMIASIAWHWLPVLLAGSFVGGFLGVRILSKLSKQAVKFIFTAVACISGILLIF